MLGHIRATIVTVEKAKSTYSERAFVALSVQRAMRMRHIVVCDLSGSTIFFPHNLVNGRVLEKKFLNIEFVVWFSLQVLFEAFLILRRNERDIIKNVG